MSKPAPKNDPRPKFEYGKGHGLRHVPTEAFRLSGAESTFAVGDPHEMKAPFSALARSSQPINHWYWGKIIHDMSGFSADHPRIPLDYLHYSDEIIGYLDKFEVKKDGLHCSGQMVSIAEGDRADQLMRQAKAGIPYQASIFFRTDSIEELQSGAKASVNGYSVEGPAIIIRQWGLRGLATCPYGADHRTQSQFSDGESMAVSVTVSQETQMSNTSPGGATQVTEATPPQSTETQLTDSQKTRESVLGELKKFTEKFGAENATKWLSEGISYEVALERFAEQQAEALKQANEKNTKLTEELKTTKSLVDRGETTSAQFNVDETEKRDEAKDTSKFAHLGENRAKIAASIKLPATSKK